MEDQLLVHLSTFLLVLTNNVCLSAGNSSKKHARSNWVSSRIRIYKLVLPQVARVIIITYLRQYIRNNKLSKFKLLLKCPHAALALKSLLEIGALCCDMKYRVSHASVG